MKTEDAEADVEVFFETIESLMIDKENKLLTKLNNKLNNLSFGKNVEKHWAVEREKENIRRNLIDNKNKEILSSFIKKEYYSTSIQEEKNEKDKIKQYFNKNLEEVDFKDLENAFKERFVDLSIWSGDFYGKEIEKEDKDNINYKKQQEIIKKIFYNLLSKSIYWEFMIEGLTDEESNIQNIFSKKGELFVFACFIMFFLNGKGRENYLDMEKIEDLINNFISTKKNQELIKNCFIDLFDFIFPLIKQTQKTPLEDRIREAKWFLINKEKLFSNNDFDLKKMYIFYFLPELKPLFKKETTHPTTPYLKNVTLECINMILKYSDIMKKHSSKRAKINKILNEIINANRFNNLTILNEIYIPFILNSIIEETKETNQSSFNEKMKEGFKLLEKVMFIYISDSKKNEDLTLPFLQYQIIIIKYVIARITWKKFPDLEKDDLRKMLNKYLNCFNVNVNEELDWAINLDF